MCELMGMSFNNEIHAKFSFREFVNRGSKNPDGWGMAFYPGKSYAAQVIKEPLLARSSSLAGFIKDYHKIRSSIYLSHVRHATSEVNYANTHPFVRVFRGREYVFAHNGDLRSSYRSSLPVGNWTPVGTTDSEHAFCHIMNVIENQIDLWDDNSFAILEDTLRNINNFGSFNCLLSNGEYLFCYRDKDGYKGLTYTHRQAPFSTVRLRDEDFEINLATMKSTEEKGYIVATHQLTDGEEWTDLDPGCLLVFKKGEKVYPRPALIADEHIMHALKYIRTKPERASIFMIANIVGMKIHNIAPLIEALKAKGYIRQDSRDADGPYHPGATYYTVPHKRNEIDSLLEEDKSNSIVPIEYVMSQKAEPEERTPMCLKCMTAYKEGSAFCRICCGNLEMIDTRMVEILYLLNSKGYPTVNSCSGHADNYDIYITINTYIDPADIPEGFTRNRDVDRTILRSIPYHKAKGIKNKKAREAITPTELLAYSDQNLFILTEWIKQLPTKIQGC